MILRLYFLIVTFQTLHGLTTAGFPVYITNKMLLSVLPNIITWGLPDQIYVITQWITLQNFQTNAKTYKYTSDRVAKRQ